MENYRLLNYGEIIQEGDEYLDRRGEDWHKCVHVIGDQYSELLRPIRRKDLSHYEKLKRTFDELGIKYDDYYDSVVCVRDVNDKDKDCCFRFDRLGGFDYIDVARDVK